MSRSCGGCTLCCRLLPVRELHKAAGERCKHQRTGKGCAVYDRLTQVSLSCKLWNCRWLVNDDTADLSRPDRSHYVIDLMPDFITVDPNDGSGPTNIPVIQVWVDPKYPDAHREPDLRRYLARRGEDGYAAIIRYSGKDGFVLFPPVMASDGQWHEHRDGEVIPERTPEELFDGLRKIGEQNAV